MMENNFKKSTALIKKVMRNPVNRILINFELNWKLYEAKLISEGKTDSQIEMMRELAFEKYLRDLEDQLRKDEAE